MPTQILSRQAIARTWQATGGDYTIHLAGLAADAGRMGQTADLADAAERFVPRWAVAVELTLETAPAAGSVVEIYWAASRDNASFPGGVTGNEGAYRPEKEDQGKRQLLLVGCLVLSADADPVVQAQVFEFWPPARYGAPVVVNKSGQPLKNREERAHRITLVPLVDEFA